MNRRVARFFFIAIFFAGCFDPQISSGAFTCTADHPQCPEGFSCIDNSCVQGTNPPANLPDLTQADALESTIDLANAHDLAKSSCVASGGDCTYHRDAVCCSGSCVYSTNKCK